MRLTLLVVVAYLASVFAMPGRAEDKDEGKAYEFKTVLTAFDGGSKEACEKILTSKKEWEAFIESCTDAEVREKLAKTEVDFDKEVIAAVCLGKMSAVYGDEEYFEKIGEEGKKTGISKVTMKGDAWTIRYTVVQSDVRREVATFPVFVIRLPKRGQTFSFKRTDYSTGG